MTGFPSVEKRIGGIGFIRWVPRKIRKIQDFSQISIGIQDIYRFIFWSRPLKKISMCCSTEFSGYSSRCAYGNIYWTPGNLENPWFILPCTLVELQRPRRLTIHDRENHPQICLSLKKVSSLPSANIS